MFPGTPLTRGLTSSLNSKRDMRIELGPWRQISPDIINARAESFKNNIGSAAASAVTAFWRNSYVNLNNMATWHALIHVSGIRPKNSNQLNRLERLKLHHASLIPVCFPEVTL